MKRDLLLLVAFLLMGMCFFGAVTGYSVGKFELILSEVQK